MARILRGEIYWADLDPVQGSEQAGTHPVLILSHEVFNERSATVIAVAITSQEPKGGFPLSYALEAGTLPKKSWVKISQIRILAAQRLFEKAGQVSPEALDTIVEGLNEIIGS